MKIPKSFSLFGQVITVHHNDGLAHANDTTGEARFRSNAIYLQSNTNGYPVPHSKIEQTFFHELTHFMLHAMSSDRLNKDEVFVDTFASLLHQALTTAKY